MQAARISRRVFIARANQYAGYLRLRLERTRKKFSCMYLRPTC
jgi:hypothetical protein